MATTDIITPGDNPSYAIRLNNSQYQDSAGYQEIPALSNNPNNPVASPGRRDFDNPIYGSEGVQERELDNPIYGADDSAAEEVESEDPYTIPDSPPCNVYDRVADDRPFGPARVGIVSTDDGGSNSGVYSTIAT